MSAATLLPPRIRFTRSRVERMLEAGIFEGQRFELIDGELIDKMGQLPPHAYSVARYTTWLSRVFTGNGQVRVQLPMDVGPADRERSQPEPDLVVVTNEAIDQLRHPDGEQTLLVVEVADSSVRFDITIKRDLYARAGVREYWVLDIPTRELIVYRHPQAGQYTEQHRLTESELASPLARPDASIAVSDLLPPR